MKTIVWFSNCIQSNGKNKSTGSWLFSMSRLLVSTGRIHLINITNCTEKNSSSIKHRIINDHFEEYLLPIWSLEKNGLPNIDNCNKIEDLCKKLRPDLIHIWGVENYFCTLLPTLNLDIPLLLEIQGLRTPCAEVYYGDLSIKDTISCLGLREILYFLQRSIYKDKNRMKVLGDLDKIAIKQYKHISTQSQWVRDYVKAINNKCVIYETGMSIREEFWSTKKWEHTESRIFYCSANGPIPYKSVQTAIKALKIVTERYPEAKLYVIGNFKDRNNRLHQPGYLTFIKKTIKNLELTNNVMFTGPLNANEIIDIMHKCIGMVQTSYVESYSLAVAEAQVVGVPSIISYAGAMPELATDRESGLFYSPGDYVSCAAKMIELIEDDKLANKLSHCAYELAHNRNDNEVVLSKQLNIYNKIIDEKS